MDHAAAHAVSWHRGRFAHRAQLETTDGAHAGSPGYGRLRRHPRAHTPRDANMSTIACGVLLLAIFTFVFYPQRHTARQTAKTRLDFLREQKEVLYENLRDLNFEYSAGKYTAEGYAARSEESLVGES